MSLARVLAGLVAGTALAALAASAARQTDATGGDAAVEQPVQPAQPAQKEQPAAPPEVAAPPAVPPASTAAWSRTKTPRVTAGVIARAARTAKEREAPPPAAERRKGGKGRGAGSIISVEIDWNASTPAP